MWCRRFTVSVDSFLVNTSLENTAIVLEIVIVLTVINAKVLSLNTRAAVEQLAENKLVIQ